MKKQIAQRLKKARISAGYKRAKDFCDAHNITYPTYIHHEGGDQGIKHEALEKYARLLGVSVAWLMTGEEAGIKDAIPLTNRVPLISWVQAGAFTYTGDPKTLQDAEEWLNLPASKGASFALRVKGDSMDNIAPEGTIILVDYEDTALIDRKLYIFECNDELTFKRYRKVNGKRWLEPDSSNKKHKPLTCDEKPMRVIGRVYMVLKSLD